MIFTLCPPSSWITRDASPSGEKCLVRKGIKPQSPAYMAIAPTTELLTTPAELNQELKDLILILIIKIVSSDPQISPTSC